ncbi:MAG: cadmium-translocating P-type ATPase [Candidatus Sericytochromatia bacterium]|nr:cadmium-translocating P-type ATPase [Candidatus Tanganyikabacteria bacterium]
MIPEHARPLRTVSYTLTGLECADCASQLERAIAHLPGVVEAGAQFAAARLEVVFQPEAIDEARILRTISEMGYGTKQARALTAGLRAEYALDGLDCGDCAVHVEQHVSALPGVREARVNFGAAKLEVVFEQGTARPDIPAAVAALGYQARRQDAAGTGSSWKTKRKMFATVASGLAFVGGLAAERLSPGAAWVFFAAAVAAGGFYMARAALVALRTSRGLDINFLMTVAVLGAIGLGRWEEAAEVVFLFAVGNALAASTMDKARAALRGLLSLAPPQATVREGHRELRRPVEEVQPGAVIVVRPGDRIPLDGEVVEGRSAVDQAALTGESMPVEKAPGDAVFAGSLNGLGAMAIRVVNKAEDGALARIVHMVEEAQARRAPIQQFVDRFARYYTPFVLAVAASIAIGPWLFGLPDWSGWVYQALALLVVACPCALVVSTPVAVAAALGAASRKGLLIKGGAYLEALGRVEAVAFDKTGTLTAGRPVVTDLVTTDGYRPDELLAIAAALEHRSEHPVAEAILRRHRDQTRAEPEDCCSGCRPESHLLVVDDFQAFPGRGVAGRLDGRRLFVGNPPFMVDQGVPIGAVGDTLEQWREAGMTPILVGESGRLLGLLAIADTPREEATEALRDLRAAGIRHIALLTGDHQAVAERIARDLGADEVVADLLPDAKVKAVQELLGRHERVAMVGDGINDAPALATSTVGVAMGVRGSDAALETADVVLMQDDLRLLAPAVRLGREALSIVKQNIAISLGIKAVLVALAIPQVLTLGMAVLGDVGTTLLVILNGMRLLRARALKAI